VWLLSSACGGRRGGGGGATAARANPIPSCPHLHQRELCVDLGWQQQAQGSRGIKAILIYPMNALATDQARRLADLIHTIPALAGLRAGLYIGSSDEQQTAAMTATSGSVTLMISEVAKPVSANIAIRRRMD
jgi:hypothetical protein